jgi:hypothetical protein
MKEALYHRGKYENNIGFIILDEVPSNVEAPVRVRVGFTESRVVFQPHFLAPLMMMENPPFTPPEKAQPVVSSMGQRIVIIGVDLEGSPRWVGNYGIIIKSHYPLQPGHALVYIAAGQSSGTCSYFDETSLCRSLQSQ